MEILKEHVGLVNQTQESNLVISSVSENRIENEFSEKISISAAEIIKNARLLFESGDKSLSNNLLRAYLNRDFKNTIVMQTLASQLESSQKYSESIRIREQILKIDYGFMTVFQLAQSYYLNGDDQLALDKYYEALSILTEEDETLFEIYKNMGNIFVRQGDFDAAEEYYNKACTLNNRSDILFVNYATLEVQKQDFEKARECFRHAVEINPENDKAWIGLAMVHNHFADFELGWANLEKGLDINPKNRTGVYLFAQWALRDQKYSKAIHIIENYLSDIDCDEDLSLSLINFYCLLGNAAAAKLELQKLEFWIPESSNVKRLKCLI